MCDRTLLREYASVVYARLLREPASDPQAFVRAADWPLSCADRRRVVVLALTWYQELSACIEICKR